MENTARNKWKATVAKGDTSGNLHEDKIWKSDMKLEKCICTKIIHKNNLSGKMKKYNKNEMYDLQGL